MKVLLTGATGFIGSRLAQPLLDAGHEVRAMTRRPESYDGPGEPVQGDTADPDSIARAMADCEAAYYLVHALDENGDFGEKDAESARSFGKAAVDAGLQQVIYLGGLGRQGDDLSDHLASRQEVEGELTRSGAQITTLRAALVIGKGSASFELLRQVVKNLPLVVIPPKASSTRVQPIAVDDVVRYLVECLAEPATRNATFEVGGPDVMTYEQMLHTMAKLLGKDTPGLKVPIIPTRLAKLGVRLITDVDPQLAATLLDSLGNDVVVTDGDRIRRLLPGPLLTFEEMLEVAVREE